MEWGMAMSNDSKKQKVEQQPSVRKQQAGRERRKNDQEEFGAEFGFNPEQFNEEGQFAARQRPRSERTAWH